MEDEVVVSFDVTSLYTNVPVNEAIDICSDLLYSGKYTLPPVRKDTFKKLLKMSTCDVVMLTHDGYYRQKDGLAMGSPPAPPLANGWLYTYDSTIRDNAKLYSRYMDDIFRSITKSRIDAKLAEINDLHPSLKFTIEMEKDGHLPFLDMVIIRSNGKLSSKWYCKPTDTGLIMNFHAVAPLRYKRSVVSGFVYRIHNSCSTWQYFHTSLCTAKRILDNNQYPSSFYEPIISDTISKLLTQEESQSSTSDSNEEEQADHLVFLQYRGKPCEDYVRSLRRIGAPCKVVLTLRKLKTMMPSLKVEVEKRLRSRVVYNLSCSRCQARYVGQTDRHLLIRFTEHIRPSAPYGRHIRLCGVNPKFENDSDVSVIQSTNRSITFLETLEALWQREVKPTINTKDEYKRRELTIKL